jgi:hypothetical protein
LRPGVTNTLACPSPIPGGAQPRRPRHGGAHRRPGGGIGTTVNDLSRTYNSAATLADAGPHQPLSGGNLTITVNGRPRPSVSLAG